MSEAPDNAKASAASGAPEPLLVASDLRVDVDGVPACDGLTLRTTGSRVLVLGAPRVLFLAATGLLPVMRGTLRIAGVPAARAVGQALIAGAALDPPMPPKWTTTEYIEWSARLSGVGRGDARTRARAAIERLSLTALAKKPLLGLVLHARRATIVAAALATGAEIIAMEDPVGGLPDEMAQTFAKILTEALAECAWLVFAPRIALASPLALTADEVIIASASHVEAQGPPTEVAGASRRFVGRISGSVATLSPLLLARGARVEEHGAHLLFDLGDSLTTSELMAICRDAGISVVELMPVVRALS